MAVKGAEFAAADAVLSVTRALQQDLPELFCQVPDL